MDAEKLEKLEKLLAHADIVALVARDIVLPAAIRREPLPDTDTAWQQVIDIACTARGEVFGRAYPDLYEVINGEHTYKEDWDNAEYFAARAMFVEFYAEVRDG